MKKMTRRLFTVNTLSFIAVIVAVAVMLSALCGSAGAKSYYHPLIEQTYRFNPDGSADVEEIRSFRFDGSFSWAFLLRGTRGDYGRYSVEFEGVWDADTGEKLRSEVSSSGSGEMIKWYYSAQNTTKRFLIRYRIDDAVQRYSDAAQFYWKAIEDEHAAIGDIAITVIPPGPSPELFKVFVHSAARPGEIEFAPGFGEALIRQGGIPQNAFAELRVLLDPDLFPDAEIDYGETYASLLDDERAIAEAPMRRARQNIMIIVISAIVLVFFLAVFIWVYIRYGREPRVEYDNIYEREPPRDMPPAVVPAILTQGSANNAELTKSFAATIIECCPLFE